MPAPSSDQNLLFGILALQVNFITRDALIKGMNAWVLEKHRSLGQILVEQGGLSQLHCDMLEAMVREHLRVHDNDPRKSLAAISSVQSVRQELQQVADPEVQASVGHLGAGGDAWKTAANVAEPSSPSLRYRKVRPHARGGLGEVFVAMDEELKRNVALKEIQSQHADNSDSRARFILEAEITGKLEHPGIVPVHGLGHYPDGRPFYAMRFIKGDSLGEAIDRFHKAGPRTIAQREIELRQLLGRFIDVCDAIAYAHSRGVLHRDLKPGNVMLGRYGETLVVDWGLAKLLGSAGSTGDELVVSADSASGTAPTQMGKAVGTPEYMSPEQAAGRLDELGPASDVYSLGATLYCVLTGKAPFRRDGEGGLGELYRKVERGDFPLPRQVNSLVPRALEAICLKAMATKPADRYASPEDLAKDVQQWLADLPTTAYREPWRVRLGRWVRRRQTAVAAVGAVLLTASVALGISTVVIEQALKNEEKARGEEAKARRLEEDARKEAEDKSQRACLSRDFLVSVFERGPAMTGRQILDDADRRLPTLFSDQPELRQELQGEVNKALDRITATAPLAMILEMRGTVSLEAKQQLDRQAKRSTLLYAGDTLTLGEDAEVRVVVLSDLHQETLRPGTTVTPARKGLQPTTALRDRSDDLIMPFVRLPKGTFYIGWDGNSKCHLTEIKEDFEICLYDVTQGQWEAVMGSNPSYFVHVTDLADEERKLLPVEQVSWDDTQKFLEKLNEKYDEKGYLYRLPTEVEWEYACRGGARTLEECSFHFYLDKPTNDLSSDQANFHGRSPVGNAPRGKYLARTTRVGAYPPNKLGLCDMHGNVWQMTASSGAGSPPVLRGGSWEVHGGLCRAAGRVGIDPLIRGGRSIGFRLARVPRLVPARAR